MQRPDSREAAIPTPFGGYRPSGPPTVGQPGAPSLAFYAVTFAIAFLVVFFILVMIVFR